MNKYTTVIKHEHKQGKSLVFYVIMTPFPFYKNIFQADLVVIKMGLYWPNFSLVFLIHLFLYVGVYCIVYHNHGPIQLRVLKNQIQLHLSS